MTKHPMAEAIEAYPEFTKKTMEELVYKENPLVDLHEPPPRDSWHPAIQPMVVEELQFEGYNELADDIHKRAEMGKQKYGTLLKPFNGRNALTDLYQEVLDAIVYMRQVLYEDSYGKPVDEDSLEGVYSNSILEDIYSELINIASTIKYENEQASPEALSESPTHMP
jgi:hypothetical protein